MEEWKAFETIHKKNYEISSLGQIREARSLRILSASCDTNGYPCWRGENVHRIVAKVFLLNEYDYNEVNHINGIKIDNRVENLEWVSRSQNMLHAFATGLKKPTYHMSKLSEDDVLYISNYAYLYKFPTVELGKIFEVLPGSISNILSGKTWSHITMRK